MTFLPIVFPADETEFKNFGLGRLTECTSCTVTEALNADNYDLTLTYPADSDMAEYLTVDNIIMARSNIDETGAQPFRIYYTEENLQDGLITVKAIHDCLNRLKNCACTPGSISGTVSEIFTEVKSHRIVGDSDWAFTFVSNLDTEATISFQTPTSLYDVIYNSTDGILAKFGADVQLNGYTVTVSARRGADNGVTVREADNIASLVKTTDASQCVTGVIPYWAVTDDAGVTKVRYSNPKIIPVDGSEMSYDHLLTVDCSSDIQKPSWASDNWRPTTATMREYGQMYVAKNYSSLTPVTYAAGVVNDMDAVRGIIHMGDTALVLAKSMSTRVKAMVVGTTFDCLLDTFSSVTIGSVKANLAETLISMTESSTGTTTTASSVKTGSDGYFKWEFNSGLSLVDVAASVPVTAVCNKQGSTSGNYYSANFTITIPDTLTYIADWTWEDSDGSFIGNSPYTCDVGIVSHTSTTITVRAVCSASATIHGQAYVHYRAHSPDITDGYITGKQNWKWTSDQNAYSDCTGKNKVFELDANTTYKVLAKCSEMYAVLKQVDSRYLAGYTKEDGGATDVSNVTSGKAWTYTEAVPIYAQTTMKTKVATIPANTDCYCLAVIDCMFLISYPINEKHHRIGWTNISGGVLD